MQQNGQAVRFVKNKNRDVQPIMRKQTQKESLAHKFINTNYTAYLYFLIMGNGVFLGHADQASLMLGEIQQQSIQKNGVARKDSKGRVIVRPRENPFVIIP